jgi:hypothetical protein
LKRANESPGKGSFCACGRNVFSGREAEIEPTLERSSISIFESKDGVKENVFVL